MLTEKYPGSLQLYAAAKRSLTIVSAASILLALSTSLSMADGIKTTEDHSKALSGERTLMGRSYNLNPDCSLATLPAERILQAPAHGSVDIVEASIFPNYKSGAHMKCNARKAPGIEEYYTSKSGYSGNDEYKLRVSYRNGQITDVTVKVNVIK